MESIPKNRKNVKIVVSVMNKNAQLNDKEFKTRDRFYYVLKIKFLRHQKKYYCNNYWGL